MKSTFILNYSLCKNKNKKIIFVILMIPNSILCIRVFNCIAKSKNKKPNRNIRKMEKCVLTT